MNALFKFLQGALAVVDGLALSVITWYRQTPAPVAPAKDNLSSLIALMKSQEMDEGPMPGTGGVIHVDSDAMTAEVAALIIKFSGKYMLGLPTLRERIALMAAWIRAESDFDPTAIDPNDENLPKNPTAIDVLNNLDLGIAQFSWRTLVALPDFKGMSVDQIKTQALDPEWAIEAMFEFCDNLLRQARAAVLDDPKLLLRIPNSDPLYLGVQFYNQGPTSTLSMTRGSGVANWKYAVAIADRYKKWLPLFV
jgi:hypothetical protein